MTKKNRTKISLIRPPSVIGRVSFLASQFPINLAYLGAHLRKEGYDVEIWDYEVEEYNEESLIKRIRDFEPSLIGISCFTPTVINAHTIAIAIKKNFPDTLIVVGGVHISALPAETLEEFPQFDIGIMGEGEETLAELCKRVELRQPIERIEGTVYRTNGKTVVMNRRPPMKHLDAIPPPARDLLKIDLYKGQSHRGFSRDNLRITEIHTSRGCPVRCIFCASDVTSGRGVRFRSAEHVISEIKECVEDFSFDHFVITDDTFNLNTPRLKKIMKAFVNYGVTWSCNARVNTVSRELLQEMADSGCKGITFGVESGSPRILDLVKKHITVEQTKNAFKWSKAAGIKYVEADFILGSHPSETMEDVNKSIQLIDEIEPDILSFSVIAPYPGTAVYDMMRSKNLLNNDIQWDNFVLFGKEPAWRTENFSPDELVRIQNQVLRRFYFRPSYIYRQLFKKDSLSEWAYWIKGAMAFFKLMVKAYFKRA